MVSASDAVDGEVIAAILALLIGTAQAGTEREHQEILCAGNALEWRLPDGARVDCLSATHAIEVDFSEKWAEAYGQALYYAMQTGLRPGIILVCRSTACQAHLDRLLFLVEALRQDVTVWACPHDARELRDDCREW